MKFFWVVGESSGDRHASRLITALDKASDSMHTHYGMCGEEMRKSGCEMVADISEASLMGLTEVIRHLPRMIKLRDRLVSEIEEKKPDLVVLLDFPDFNLSLLKTLRKRLGREVPVLYYISPQIWAWRRGRAKMMANLLDVIAVIFPFEVDFYSRYGLEAVFFGHPMAGEIKPSDTKENLLKSFNLDEASDVITLMPGSRDHEVERHLPVMLEAVELFQMQNPGVIAQVVKANTVKMKLIKQIVASRTWVNIVERTAVDSLSVSRAAIIKSGTSTVEAALVGSDDVNSKPTPFTVMYKVSPLSYSLARMLVRGVNKIAMVNILAGKEIVPERIQDQAVPNRLKQDLENMWEGEERDRIQNDLSEVSKSLGTKGSSDRLAEWILERFGVNDE